MEVGALLHGQQSKLQQIDNECKTYDCDSRSAPEVVLNVGDVAQAASDQVHMFLGQRKEWRREDYTHSLRSLDRLVQVAANSSHTLKSQEEAANTTRRMQMTELSWSATGRALPFALSWCPLLISEPSDRPPPYAFR